MPELASRYTHEADLAQALAGVNGQYRELLISAAGDPPDARAVPQWLWDEYQNRTAEEIRRAAIIVYLLAWDEMDLGPLIGRPTAEADLWARRRGELSAGEITATTRQRFAQAAAGAVNRMTLGVRMGDVFTLGRAEAAAVTEITAAITAGEVKAADYLEIASGIQLVPYWATEQDERVCKICYPLDSLPRERWEQAYPDGPPAHPRCRCSLNWLPRAA